MSGLPEPVEPGPVKECREPVECLDCGRPTWSRQSLCVFCRLGWPDPKLIALDRPRPRAGRRPFPPPPMREVALDDEGRIAEDVSCIVCDYNLRSLRLDDACPECGERVEVLLRTHPLHLTDADWLHSLAAGSRMLFAGAIGIILAILGTLFGMHLGAASALWLGATGLAVGGAWRLTVPEPAAGTPMPRRTQQRFFCVAARLTALMMLAQPAWFALQQIARYFGNPPSGATAMFLGLLLHPLVVTVSGVASVLCGAAVMYLCGLYVLRMDHWELTNTARFVAHGSLAMLAMLAAGSVVGLFVSPWGVAIALLAALGGVFLSFCGLVVLWQCGTVLRQAADLSTAWQEE